MIVCCIKYSILATRLSVCMIYVLISDGWFCCFVIRETLFKVVELRSHKIDGNKSHVVSSSALACTHLLKSLWTDLIKHLMTGSLKASLLAFFYLLVVHFDNFLWWHAVPDSITSYYYKVKVIIYMCDWYLGISSYWVIVSVPLWGVFISWW